MMTAFVFGESAQTYDWYNDLHVNIINNSSSQVTFQ